MTEPIRTPESLRIHFAEELAPIRWKELELFFAKGIVIEIDASLDLVEVAVQMALDNAEQLRNWMDSGLVRHLEDRVAIKLSESKTTVTGVVSHPWVLIQIRE